MKESFSVLTGTKVKHLTPEDLEPAVERANAPLREALAKEVAARQEADARVIQERTAKEAVEAALVQARSETDKVRQSVLAAEQARDAALARVRELESAPPTPALAPTKVEVPKHVMDPSMAKSMEEIKKAVTALGKAKPTVQPSPVRKVAGFDLRVTARDANGDILSLRAVPST